MTLLGRPGMSRISNNLRVLGIPAIGQIIVSVTLTQLSAFVMVARLGSVKDAAKMLNVSDGRFAGPDRAPPASR